MPEKFVTSSVMPCPHASRRPRLQECRQQLLHGSVIHQAEHVQLTASPLESIKAERSSCQSS